MEHLADELDCGRFVGILLLEVHHQPKCPILEGGVGRTDDDGVPFWHLRVSSRLPVIGERRLP